MLFLSELRLLVASNQVRDSYYGSNPSRVLLVLRYKTQKKNNNNNTKVAAMKSGWLVLLPFQGS